MATLHQLQQGLFKAKEAGETERQQKISDAIRQHPTFQEQSRKKLSLGFNELEGDARTDAIHKHTARSLGIHEKDLDSRRGMGVWGRTKLAFQPTDQDKVKHLEDTYGRENIRGVEIGGDTQFLYRDDDETSGKWRRVDEQGASLADFTADLAGAVPEVGAAIAGGVKGAALGSTAGPVGTVAGGVIGAAAAGFGAGAAQDVAVRAASGEDIQPGEIAARRGKEAALGAGIDVATLGAGRLISKGFGRGAGTAVSESAERLGAEELLTAGQRSSEKAALRESEVLGEIGEDSTFTRGLAGQLGAQKQLVEDVATARTQSDLAADEAFEGIAQRLEGENLKYADAIRSSDADLARAVRGATQSQIDRLGAGREFSEEAAGERFIKTLEPELRNAKQRSDEAFTLRNELAEERGIRSTANELQEAITDGLGVRGVGDQRRVNSFLSAGEIAGADVLGEAVGSGADVSLSRLQQIIGDLDASIPSGKDVGFTGPQKDAIQVSRKLKDLRKRKLEASPKEVQDAWKDADATFKDDFGRFTRGKVADILATEQLGESAQTSFKMSPTEMINTAIRDPKAIGDIVDATGNSAAVKRSLRQAVLSKANLGTQIDIKPDVIRALWGKEEAARRISYINDLNKFLKANKLNPSDLSARDLNDLFGPGATSGKKQALKAVKDRALARQKQSELISNKLIKKVANGDLNAPSNAYQFADDLTNKSVSVSDAEGFVERLSPVEQQALGAEVFGNILQKARNNDGNITTAGMRRALGSKSSRQKLDILAGDGTVQTLEDMATLFESATVKQTTKGPTARFGLSGLLNPFFVVSNIGEGVASRVFAAAHGSKILRRALTENENADEALRDMLSKLLGTSQGIQSLTIEAEKDPQMQSFLDQQ